MTDPASICVTHATTPASCVTTPALLTHPVIHRRSIYAPLSTTSASHGASPVIINRPRGVR